MAAPADLIWDLISDLGGWSVWNPLYTEVQGRLRIGEKLKVTEALPGRPSRTITPTVVDWEPPAQILWREDGGMMSRTVRYLEIEALSETGCIFSNGAFFHGLLGEQGAKSHRSAIYRGYEALGEAVKRIAEDRRRQAQGGA
ncbi:MAG: SRPBCC domain-containing protein [Pseudomonadota bacterium]|nr:SRPBCC domain-containing protein [Pseudomonadota bacterium]